MSYVAIWLQACLHWRCAYFQTLSRNDTIFVVDWDILYKLCGSANKWSKGFVLSGKIWRQFFSCNEACSKYHTHSATTPKYTLTQRLVSFCFKLRKNKEKWQDCSISTMNKKVIHSPMFNHHSIIPGGSFRGRREEKWGSFQGCDHFGVMRSIWGSFRGRDHFGGCTVLCEGSPCLFPFIFTGQLGITGKKVWNNKKSSLFLSDVFIGVAVVESY